jgi:peptide deformylase
MIREIVNQYDPILREEMPRFDFNNPSVDPVQLYNDLGETMIENDGMGLSANQIGVRARAFVIRAEEIIGVFNPKIVYTSDELIYLEEGCLSYPNLFVKIKRPKFIRVRFTHPDGVTETRKFDGLTARAFQHELDHLDGVLFTKRANGIHLAQAKKLVKKLNKKYGVLKPKSELSLEAREMMEWLKA